MLYVVFQLPIYYTEVSCKASTILDDIIVGTLLSLGINAMMALRVYAMYGRSKKVGAFLIVCFTITQVLNLASSLELVIGAHIYVVPGYGCSFDETNVTVALQLGFYAVMCAYEVVLLGLALHSAFKNQESSTRSSWSDYNTLWATLIRDNVLYFLLATLSWALYASSWVPTLPANVQNSVVYNVAVDWLGIYAYTMLGPIMMLSIHRFDAKQVRGGTSNGVEVDIMEFATLGAGSLAGVRSISEGPKV